MWVSFYNHSAFKAWVQDKWGKTKSAGSKAIDKVKEAGSTAGKKIKGVFTDDNEDSDTTAVRVEPRKESKYLC